MLPEAPIAAMLGRARDKTAATRRALEKLVGINRDARELFLDDKGELMPAAARLFAQLSHEAQLNRLDFEPDARFQDHLLGRQHMVRFLGAMLHLDQNRLHFLQRKLGDDK